MSKNVLIQKLKENDMKFISIPNLIKVINNSTTTSLFVKQIGINQNVAEFYYSKGIALIINSIEDQNGGPLNITLTADDLNRRLTISDNFDIISNKTI